MAFTETHVVIPPDASPAGKSMRLLENTISAVVVEMEAIVLSDPTTPTQLAGVTSGGALKTDASATTQPISGAISFTAPQHVIADSGTITTVSTVSTVSAVTAISNALPTGTNTIGAIKQTDGTNVVVTDPCQGQTKVYTPISVTAGATLIAGTSSKRTYICGIQLVSATAQNIAIVEGTGTVCATNPVGVMGGATAATGWNFSANGGLTFGNGVAAVAATTVNANNLCLLTSSSGQISGNIVSVVQ